MYVRKKVIKGHTYYYLVRGERHGKKVKQKVVQYLGAAAGGLNPGRFDGEVREKVAAYVEKELGTTESTTAQQRSATRDVETRTTTPKELEALAEEARKFKNAEEFVKAKEFSIDELEIEKPVARVIEVLPDTKSSGFHEKFSNEFNGIPPSWAVIIGGKPNNLVEKSVSGTGLKFNTREAVRGNKDSTVTDIYLPNVKQGEIDEATKAFDKFADNYQSKLTDFFNQVKKHGELAET